MFVSIDLTVMMVSNYFLNCSVVIFCDLFIDYMELMIFYAYLILLSFINC
jgi:hypothetical protein